MIENEDGEEAKSWEIYMYDVVFMQVKPGFKVYHGEVPFQSIIMFHLPLSIERGLRDKHILRFKLLFWIL